MQTNLCVDMLDNAIMAYPDLKGAIVHSDRGAQYTSQTYRDAVIKHSIIQSMNSAGGRCHDNARCESMWARMKSELFYGRYDTKKFTKSELKVKIWRYFIIVAFAQLMVVYHQWLREKSIILIMKK